MLVQLQPYWLEFVTIATVHLLAVASPGPDFAIVLKHSINYGKRAAIITSVGIGLAILLHVAYSLLGIGILIQTTPWLFQALSYAAAAYLAYIGIQAIRATANTGSMAEKGEMPERQISDKKAFVTGFLTNGLNPKATLFFLSLFAVVISAQTPNEIKVVYGLYLAFATGLWFIALSLVLSSLRVRSFLRRQGHWFDRLMGVLLIALAVKLVWPV
ncbi:LysE family translocator [Aliiglaciecola sp. CAU 1673]|uniref:LysE family translocator n=1 Tax=Aliiglaciecola sp. CAU 1673 TaxID=3032595 RepID=UPI0023DC98C7|nr:LysE family translocator [Aliiglaciecola sp. CAU 1673]MDF2179863.1 LysE family translocator [Aliiglaciecola sp. CAU 1673]